MSEFEGKIILVTGSASGIGRDVAIAFANAGGTVIGTDINHAGGHETDACIKEAGGNSHFIKADISNVKAVKAVIDEIVDRYGSL
ncbi:MAG: NAD(P)-dependent dehydrogenase (short-subunit alcohol dehydrogenase family), partial [Candidatus Promineifilaceae bacterium]